MVKHMLWVLPVDTPDLDSSRKVLDEAAENGWEVVAMVPLTTQILGVYQKVTRVLVITRRHELESSQPGVPDGKRS